MFRFQFCCYLVLFWSFFFFEWRRFKKDGVIGKSLIRVREMFLFRFRKVTRAHYTRVSHALLSAYVSFHGLGKPQDIQSSSTDHSQTRTHSHTGMPWSYHGDLLAPWAVCDPSIVLVIVFFHEQPVGCIAASGCRHIAHLHVIVVRRRALRAELPAVIESTDEKDDAEERGDGGTDGDVQDFEPSSRRTWYTQHRRPQLPNKELQECS